MLIKHRRLAVLAALSACLCAGCQPDVSPTPSPAPTYRCTPEAGGAEFNCSQPQHDEMIAKDNLYTEAEAVYRRYLAEDVRISREGGTDAPTDELLATTSGAFLQDAMTEYELNLERSITVRGGDREVKSLARLVGVSKAGSIVAMQACTDASTAKIFKNGKFFGNGLITRDDLYFAEVDSQLKLIGADGKEVQSCDS